MLFRSIIGKTIETAAIASGLILPTKIASTILKPTCISIAIMVGQDKARIFLVMLPLVKSLFIRKRRNNGYLKVTL